MMTRRCLAAFAFLAFSVVATSRLYAYHDVGEPPAPSGPISIGPFSGGGVWIKRTDNYLTTAAPGTSPNGNTWVSYLTGTNPVAIYDADGSLMFDPKGRNINIIDFRYGYFSTISSTTPGPYFFTTGTGNPGSVSSTSTARTLPAGTWAALTTFPSRLGGNISLVGSPTLATSGSNIASSNGWFNQPWSFGPIAPGLTQELMYSTTAGQGFRAAASANMPSPVNLLGYGNGIGMFTYLEDGVNGNQYGAVIPTWFVPVPEPSTYAMTLAGLACGGFSMWRRRNRA